MQSAKMIKRVQRGFTLIELMIVVAIIGILAAVAIPAYQDYVLKAKISKVTTAVESVKTAIAQFAQENGGQSAVDALTIAAGGDWSSLGLSAAPNATNEVSSIAVTNGAVVATLQNIKPTTIDGKKVTWTPVVGSSSLTWTVAAEAGSDPVLINSVAKWK